MQLPEPKAGCDHLIIYDVPRELWAAYCEQARVAIPERGDGAPHALLSEFLLSVAGATRTAILTDIPAEVWATFTALTAEVKMTPEQFFIAQLRAAGRGMSSLTRLLNLFLLRVAPDGSRRLLIPNVNQAAWQNLDRATKAGVGLGAYDFFCAILDAAGSGELRLVKNEAKEEKYQTTGMAGAGPEPNPTFAGGRVRGHGHGRRSR